MKYKKQIIVSLLIILVLFFLLIGVTFLFRDKVFVSSNTQYSQNAIKLEFVEENAISIKSMLPIPDSVGKKMTSSGDKEGIQTYFDFVIKNTTEATVPYEIYLTKENLENEIQSNYIKIYLTDAYTDKPFGDYSSEVPSYYDLRVARSDANGKKILSGVLKGKESQKIRLRMWLAETYPIGIEEQSFQAKVNVKVN